VAFVRQKRRWPTDRRASGRFSRAVGAQAESRASF
jgi:hypothetical protein